MCASFRHKLLHELMTNDFGFQPVGKRDTSLFVVLSQGYKDKSKHRSYLRETRASRFPNRALEPFFVSERVDPFATRTIYLLARLETAHSNLLSTKIGRL